MLYEKLKRERLKKESDRLERLEAIRVRDEQWHKHCKLGYIQRLEAMTEAIWSCYYNTLEAIKGGPVWCHSCKSTALQIRQELKNSGEMFKDHSAVEGRYPPIDKDWWKWETE